MSTAGGNKDQQVFTSQIIAQTSGDAVAELINVIARQADEHGVALYLVGGPVRDLLLGRAISDIDFVIEGDAIAFAGDLSRSYGGTIQAHRPFGTAKWRLDARAAAKLSLSHAVIPDHIDLAMARSEHYAHPTALPLVSPAKIDQDLFRRDFSINALAIQLSPLQEFGRLLDPYEGHPDLRGGLIRVLHDASFIDDPTRILRAARFARRLGFEVEAHTADLMRAALPMLGRVTGPRLRNEIDMILLEAHPGDVLLRLRKLGALRSIHSAFRISKRLPALLESCLQDSPPWQEGEVVDLRSLRWSLLLVDLQEAEARAIAERLEFDTSANENHRRQCKTARARDCHCRSWAAPERRSTIAG